VEQGGHQLAVIGGAQGLGQFEQGRLVQGHRVTPSFVSDSGRSSQRLTRWPPHVDDRHGHHDQEPDLHHSRGLSLNSILQTGEESYSLALNKLACNAWIGRNNVSGSIGDGRKPKWR
jgi:hypothetical protein